MAKKIDLSRVKEFLFNHGEKVALGACAFIGVILGLWGIWSAAGAGVAEGTSKPFHVVMLERKNQITLSFNQPAPPDDGTAKKINIDWPNYVSSHQSTPLVNTSEAGLDKRRRPPVLPIAANQFQMDYVAGLVYTHRTPDTLRTKKSVYGLAPEGSELPVAPPMPKKGKKDPLFDPGAATVSLPFQQIGRAERMVIVHARFPMKDQVEAFRRALNLQSQEDQFMKNRNDLPRPEGFDVVRVEVLGEDKYSAPVTIMGLDPKDGKFTMNPRLEDLLRKAIYDERVADAMRDWIWAGLMTPMPKLANKKYPQFEFKDFDIDWTFLDDLEKRPEAMVGGGFGPGPGPMPPRPGKEGGSGLPGFGKGKERGPGGIERPPMGLEMNPRPAGAEFRAVEIPEGVLDISHPGLIARIYKTKDDEFNPYHVFGKKRPERDKAVGPEFNQPPVQANQDAFYDAWDVNPPQGAGAFGPGPGPGPGPGVGPGVKRPMGFERPPGGEKPGGVGGVGGGTGTVFVNWDRDALVRFIDVDVKPGKTYKYAIRVRLANPNFGLPVKDLEFGDLSLHKELPPSAWVDTPNITIPHEFHVYAIDQQLLDDWADDKGPKKGGVVPIYQPSFVNNFTAFQIHQWVELKKDYAKPGAEPYVIGDWVIGERQLVRKGEPIGKRLTVQAPVWLTLKDAFEVPQHLDPDVKDKKRAAKGVHTDMTPPDGKAPILVDFTGGKRLNKNNGLDEETAVDALVLMPDGKLKVFNSRESMDLKSADDDVRRDAKERYDRLVNARKRVEEVLSGAGNGPGGNNPAMPKSPVGPGLPGAKGGS